VKPAEAVGESNMRIVVDLQGAQTYSKFRGIGRYSLSLTTALARHAANHEIWIALNGRFKDTIEPLRTNFDGLVPQEHIVVFEVPGFVAEIDPASVWRARAAERLREHFLASLKPDVIFISSLFEGWLDNAVTSIGTLERVGLSVVMLYDLIPLLQEQIYLSNPCYRDHYLLKLDYLKQADLLLAISESSRRETITALNMAPERVINIAGAADSRFRPMLLSPEERQCVLSKSGLTGPFVMYSGAVDARKNVDKLIKAFSLLPEHLADGHQLLIAGKLSKEDELRYRRIAEDAGVQGDRFVLAGYVSDEELVALYNLCSVFVFPSSHEGLGLPALEAMQCGAPVIASDTSSLPELVECTEALFDPSRPDQIASKIAQVLGDSEFSTSLRRHGIEQAKKFSWEESARRALEAMEAAHDRQRNISCRSHSMSGRRPRLAFVSPLPPERTGIADYCAELLPELARHYDIEAVVCQNEVADPWITANIPLRTATWFDEHADRYDRILYHMGNSPFHEYQLGLIERRPGTVVMHDFFLSASLNYLENQKRPPLCFMKALYHSHGYYGLAYEKSRGRGAAVREFPCNKQIIDQAAGVIVHSEFSRVLADKWYGIGYSHDWAVVPQLRTIQKAARRDEARARLGLLTEDFLVCTFGLLDPTKLNHRLLDAWLSSSLSSDIRCHLVFVGENHGGDYGRQLISRIRDAAAGTRIKITGWVSPEDFELYLTAADVGVQLRTMSRGETSRAVLDCLAHGLSTVVNAHGASAEYPDDVVVRLEDEFTTDQLTAVLERLRNDAEERSRLKERGLAHVCNRHSPGRVVELYRDAIENFVDHSPSGRYRRLVSSISSIRSVKSPEQPDLLRVAAGIASICRPRDLRQLMLDVSAAVQRDPKTGAPTLLASVVLEVVENPPPGFRVEPVFFDGETKYRYARGYTLGLLGMAPRAWSDDAIEAVQGDVFLGIDWDPHKIVKAQTVLSEFRRRGILVYFVMHNVLPALQLESPADRSGSSVRETLQALASFCDGLFCASRSVADDVARWLDAVRPERCRPLGIGYLNHEADIAARMTEVLSRSENWYLEWPSRQSAKDDWMNETMSRIAR